MLPNFLVIGAQKSASSWLAKMLGQHPDVFIFPDAEPHFFDANFDKGIAWYEGHFSGRGREKAVGEKTPQYLTHPLAAERIRKTLGPEIRLVASLRHPVDRAYSHFWHGMKRGRISPDTSFEEAFLTHAGLRDEGMYGEHLERFSSYFPEESLLVLIFEEMMADRKGALADCFEFLGVATDFEASDAERRVNKAKDLVAMSPGLHRLRGEMNRLPNVIRDPLIAAGRAVFWALPRERSYEPLSDAVRAELRVHFADDIRRLEGALGRRIAAWSDARP